MRSLSDRQRAERRQRSRRSKEMLAPLVREAAKRFERASRHLDFSALPGVVRINIADDVSEAADDQTTR